MTLAGSVVEEKQSRLVEIIATAVPLRQLLAGKILGNTVLALAQMALFAGVGLVGLAFTDFASLLPALVRRRSAGSSSSSSSASWRSRPLGRGGRARDAAPRTCSRPPPR